MFWCIKLLLRLKQKYRIHTVAEYYMRVEVEWSARVELVGLRITPGVAQIRLTFIKKAMLKVTSERGGKGENS